MVSLVPVNEKFCKVLQATQCRELIAEERCDFVIPFDNEYSLSRSNYTAQASYTTQASIYTTQLEDYCGDVWEFFDTPRVRATATVKLLSLLLTSL